MKQMLLTATLTVATVTPFSLSGADVPENPNRLSLGPRFGLNFKADFNNHATYKTPTVNPGPATGGADHTYDDGYVRVDSSGNAGNLTWNWGYQNPSQAVVDSMQFHAIRASSSSSANDNPQYGTELLYQRIIGSLPASMRGRWGLEAGFGYTDLDLRNQRGGFVPVTTDTYPLNGVLPPSAGYNGTFSGPGALLGDTPVRTTTFASQSGRNKLSGDMFNLRFGPFAEWNLTRRLSFAASVGVTLAPTSVAYDFSETDTLASGDRFSTSGHSSRSKVLYGPYVSGLLRYNFNPRWGLYVGAQFQNLTDLNQSIGSRSARLDPGATLYGTVGVTWSF